MSERKAKVLIVDDDEQILMQMDWALRSDYLVRQARDRASALRSYREDRPELVILDLGLPPHPREAREGLLTLEEMLRADPRAKVIIVSGNAEQANANRAVLLGAWDIFPKPVDLKVLRVVLERALYRGELERGTPGGPPSREPFEELLGTSPAMLRIFDAVDRAAPTDVPILITGESGTGKELIARAVCRRSRRRDGAYVPINCGAIPGPLLESELFGHEKGAFTGAAVQRKGRFQDAHEGTLFLDEIGELELPLQVKILRFLQDGVIERVGGRERISVNARVIAATNRNLRQAVARGEFREDLYYRLAVVELALPPLRERREDLPLLYNSFLRRYAAEYGKSALRGFSPAAEDALLAHGWPGNVRELENCVKRTVVMAAGPLITPADLELEASHPSPGPPAAPAVASEAQGLKDARDRLEETMIRAVLKATRGNISEGARRLGISRPTLYERIEKHRIDPRAP